MCVSVCRVSTAFPNAQRSMSRVDGGEAVALSNLGMLLADAPPPLRDPPRATRLLQRYPSQQKCEAVPRRARI